MKIVLTKKEVESADGIMDVLINEGIIVYNGERYIVSDEYYKAIKSYRDDADNLIILFKDDMIIDLITHTKESAEVMIPIITSFYNLFNRFAEGVGKIIEKYTKR